MYINTAKGEKVVLNTYSDFCVFTSFILTCPLRRSYLLLLDQIVQVNFEPLQRSDGLKIMHT